ncbi:adenosine deaminase [Rhodococcus sp. NPDC003348]
MSTPPSWNITPTGPGPAPLDLDTVRTAPKALLHDHLDGGLRPVTVLELAHHCGYDGLPADDADTLADWFSSAASSGSLEQYLETFAHTVAVMQTPEGLQRVARECVADLAADGVVYAEVRFAPEQHLERGLTLDEVVHHTLLGFEDGTAQARDAGHEIRVGCLLTAMRHAARSREIADLAVRFRERGVVGFDIAGAEAGHPPSRHLDAFEHMRANNAHFTIHAGEAFGLPSIHEAIAFCGADRLGHGVRITDDIAVDDDGDARLGRLANYVRDKRIPLELCPSSNVQTGAVPSLERHPFDLLARLRFRVTVNTDNRLMSATTMSREMIKLAETFDYDWNDLERFTINALKSAFIPFPERLALIEDVVKPGYARLRGQ